MRRLYRRQLDPETQAYLGQKRAELLAEPDPGPSSTRYWKNARRSRAFDRVEAALRTMNGGTHHCMYCESNEAAHIDHYRPKADYPECTFSWNNYLLACDVCNSNAKRDRFPVQNSMPLLVNPAEEDPSDHLVLASGTGWYMPADDSIKGGPTIEICRLNREHLTEGRRRTWIELQSLVADYSRARRAGAVELASEIVRALVRRPFRSVLEELLRLHRNGDRVLVKEDCATALDGGELFEALESELPVGPDSLRDILAALKEGSGNLCRNDAGCGDSQL